MTLKKHAIKPLAAGRSRTPAAPSSTDASGWWATVSPERFAASLASLASGESFVWPALPGVRIGDIYVLATSAPDRRLRLWAEVTAEAARDVAGDWRVPLRLGESLSPPLCLRTLKQDPILATWPALQRVSADRLEAIPPALWGQLRSHISLGEHASDPPRLRASLLTPPAAPPWQGLGRGPFFAELVRRFLWPAGYTLVELLAGRDRHGADVIAFSARGRWTKVVLQLDLTGETVDECAIEELITAQLHHSAPRSLLIALGPVAESARHRAEAHHVAIWDEATLLRGWETAPANAPM